MSTALDATQEQSENPDQPETQAPVEATAVDQPPSGAGSAVPSPHWTIRGCGTTPLLSIDLSPGQTVYAEPGALLHKAATVVMDSVLADGASANRGLVGRVWAAGKRKLSGERCFVTRFTNPGPERRRVAFGPPYPGEILAVALTEDSGDLLCQRDSFIASLGPVAIDLHVQRKAAAALFGGEGLAMQRIHGAGTVFVHGGGSVDRVDLAPGEQVAVQTGALLAFDAGVRMSVRTTRTARNALFGGEGVFLTELTGPGRVWVQTLPLTALCTRLWSGIEPLAQKRIEAALRQQPRPK